MMMMMIVMAARACNQHFMLVVIEDTALTCACDDVQTLLNTCDVQSILFKQTNTIGVLRCCCRIKTNTDIDEEKCHQHVTPLERRQQRCLVRTISRQHVRVPKPEFADR
eukprot:m.153957 g.153957  ORF g.153957 m.153957 type:complete len:109 (+) comp30861_c0_seq1:1-327(+)